VHRQLRDTNGMPRALQALQRILPLNHDWAIDHAAAAVVAGATDTPDEQDNEEHEEYEHQHVSVVPDPRPDYAWPEEKQELCGPAGRRPAGPQTLRHGEINPRWQCGVASASTGMPLSRTLPALRNNGHPRHELERVHRFFRPFRPKLPSLRTSQATNGAKLMIVSVPWYQEWVAPPALRSHLACSWAGQAGADGTGYADRVLPDGCVDIVWAGSQLIVAGPDTGPVPIGLPAGGWFVGVRFAIGAAPVFLRVASSEIRDQRVPLAAIWGDRTSASIAARLENVPSAAMAARLLEQAVLARFDGAGGLDPVVVGLVASLRRGSGPAAIGRIADDLGTTTRTLHRACTSAVGYGPKTLDRVFRFRRFLALDRSLPSAPLAQLAADAGYADQAHLTRECGRLAGATPSQLRTERRCRIVQDVAPSALAG
jgi:AraC-like DNA-binding protein